MADENAPPNPSDTPSPTAEAANDESKDLFTRLGPAGIVGVLSAVLPALGGFVLLANLGTLGPWFRDMELAGLVLYAVIFMVTAGLAILPTYAQAVLGGWAFGLAEGTLGALAGFAGGSLIGYVVGRKASGDRVMKILDEQPKWRAVRDALVGPEGGKNRFFKTLLIVTLIRIPPNSPFALTNLVLSSVKTAWLPYLLGTMIGMLPRTMVAVYIATLIKGALTRDTLNEAKPVWLLPTGILLAVFVLVVLGYIANKAVKKVVGETDASSASLD